LLPADDQFHELVDASRLAAGIVTALCELLEIAKACQPRRFARKR